MPCLRAMKRAPPSNPDSLAPQQLQPSAEHAELALREAAVLMRPLVQWLLRHGATYPAFAEMLKTVFVATASAELQRGDNLPTQSALSLLSGVHRKDVRDLLQAPAGTRVAPRPTLAAQVFTRWLSDPRFRAGDGQPRALPRVGARRSFESLCRELSNDVHPRTVLEELLRLGRVALDGERVVVQAASFVPAGRLDELTALFASNAADHIAAAVSNLTRDAPKFLEQSIYADGLTAESIALLHQAARQAWADAFESLVPQAQQRVDHDRSRDGEMRMRFGVYFFSEPAKAVRAAPSAGPHKSTQSPKPLRKKIKP